MRRASRPSILGLLVLLGLLGGPAAASASDAGLRALVVRETAAEAKSDKEMKAIPEPRAGSIPGLITYLDRYARYFSRLERTIDGFRRSYAHEGPETPATDAARTQILLGLRDISDGAHGFALASKRAAARYRKVSTDAGARSIARRFNRDLKAPTKTLKRGNQRDATGRKAIADAVPAPTG